MRVRATFRMVFNVTREVEIDTEDFERWAQKRYGSGFDRELATTVWIDGLETDRLADIFPDFKVDEPLPSDFEFQYSETEDAQIVEETQSDGAKS